MSTTDHRLHDRALELAARAVDFALGRTEAAELQSHLAACPACARSAAALRTDAAALRLPATLLPSRRVDDAVYAAIAGRPAHRPRLMLLVAATVLLMVALLGVAAAGAFLRVWPTLPIVVQPTVPAVVVGPTPSRTPAAAWQSATIPPVFAGGDSTPAAVTVGGDAFVAVGGRAFRDNQAPSGGTASAWRSPDGLAWEPATSVDDLAVGDMIPTSGPEAGLVDVAWGPGGFVAVGHRAGVGRRDRRRVALGGRAHLDAIRAPGLDARPADGGDVGRIELHRRRRRRGGGLPAGRGVALRRRPLLAARSGRRRLRHRRLHRHRRVPRLVRPGRRHGARPTASLYAVGRTCELNGGARHRIPARRT